MAEPRALSASLDTIKIGANRPKRNPIERLKRNFVVELEFAVASRVKQTTKAPSPGADPLVSGL